MKNLDVLYAVTYTKEMQLPKSAHCVKLPQASL